MTEVSAAFARRLREERTKRRITQAELAERMTPLLGAQIYDSTISLLEKPGSARSIKLEEAVAAARALDVPLATLISNPEDPDLRLSRLYADLERHRARAVKAEMQLRDAQGSVERIQQEIREIENRELVDDLRTEQWPL